MIGAIVHQLTRNLNDEQVREGGFAPYFVDHTTGVYPTAASGFPWNAASMAVKGDVICDLSEDMAAEQKARVTYDNIQRLILSDDPLFQRFLQVQQLDPFTFHQTGNLNTAPFRYDLGNQFFIDRFLNECIFFFLLLYLLDALLQFRDHAVL